MKKTLFAVPLLLSAMTLTGGAPAVAATTFTVDKNHSEVSFKIRHMMSRVRGEFTDFAVTVVKDDANPANSSVVLTIEAKSIDTGTPDRDNDLRSENFFAVDKFPQITFKSSKVEKVSDTLYNVTGEFSMHGVTKVITLPVTLEGEITERGKLRVGFSTSTTINRKEFGINWNRTLDSGGVLLGDDVLAEITLELKQAP